MELTILKQYLMNSIQKKYQTVKLELQPSKFLDMRSIWSQLMTQIQLAHLNISQIIYLLSQVP